MSMTYANKDRFDGYSIVAAVQRGVTLSTDRCDHIGAAQGTACYRDTALSIVTELNRNDLMIVPKSDMEKIARYVSAECTPFDVLLAVRHLAMALYDTERGEVPER